jgi:NADH-quinone oxidoreductase subunit J
MYLVLFILFGGLCVAGALNLLFQRHPINSALSLIVVMSSLAVLYLLLGAEFLAAAQVIVYSGAIMVLFTFVIMLLNAGVEERTHGSSAAYIVGIPGVAVLVCLLSFIFLSARSHLAQARLGDYVVSTVSTSDLSKVLFRDLLLPFEVTSVLILIAILGAVALASREH